MLFCRSGGDYDPSSWHSACSGFATLSGYLESDALVAIQDINNKYTGSSSGHLIMDILHICSSFESCSFQHISRGFNQVAHELAHYAHRTGFSQLWMGVTPPFLSLLIHSDAA